MDSHTLETLTILLGIGAGFIAPVKAGTDLVKMNVPGMPGWGLLLCSLGLGELIVLLVSVYGGLEPSPQNIAGCIMAGAIAAIGASGITELHKTARKPQGELIVGEPDESEPPQLSDDDIDRLARRGIELMHAGDQDKGVGGAESRLITKSPHWLPGAKDDPHWAAGSEAERHGGGY